MFVECSSDGQIAAAYVEQQYPDQKWLPASDQALQSFLGDAPRLGKDAKGRTCLLRAPLALPLPKPRTGKGAAAQRSRRTSGQVSAEVSYGLAIRLVIALYEDAQHEPLPWRWISDTAERAGIRHRDQLELAMETAKVAGLLVVDGDRSVVLTVAGIKAARRRIAGHRDTPWGESAVPVQPAPPTSSAQLGLA